MSQWTHVSGLIRIDAIPSIDGTTINEVEKHFGKTCTYDDGSDAWDACTVPCGSEGSLRYKVERTGNSNELAWGTVSIWGDLRDYDNFTAIYEWIKEACKTYMIRSCMVKIDVEYQGSYIVTDTFDGDKTTIEIMEIPHSKKD